MVFSGTVPAVPGQFVVGIAKDRHWDAKGSVSERDLAVGAVDFLAVETFGVVAMITGFAYLSLVVKADAVLRNIEALLSVFVLSDVADYLNELASSVD